MSHKRGGYKSNKPKSGGEKQKEIPDNIDENNPTIAMFREFTKMLDDKHDRHERIVKISRDITIESKRIIFLLHNRDTEIESKQGRIFEEAQQRLDALIAKQFKAIALELEHHDSYQHLHGYTFGLQEFIEALIFYQYLKDHTVETWEQINTRFVYQIEGDEEEGEKTSREVRLVFPQVEFLLGIADFTGELMRKCINSLGSGNVEDCFRICQFVKFILSGFLGINSSGYKEIGRKLYVLKQSLAKMELVCYNIRVRGSEIPKHMLGAVASAPVDDVDVDEGFY